MPELKRPFGRTKLTKHITIFTLQTILKEEPVIRTSPSPVLTFTITRLSFLEIVLLKGPRMHTIFADGFVPPAALDLKRHWQDKAL